MKISAQEEFGLRCLLQLARAEAHRESLTLGQIAQPVRVALTGGTASPGIFEVMAVLGKERTLARLDSVLAASGDSPHAPQS